MVELRGAGLSVHDRVDGLEMARVGHQRKVYPVGAPAADDRYRHTYTREIGRERGREREGGKRDGHRQEGGKRQEDSRERGSGKGSDCVRAKKNEPSLQCSTVGGSDRITRTPDVSAGTERVESEKQENERVWKNTRGTSHMHAFSLSPKAH